MYNLENCLKELIKEKFNSIKGIEEVRVFGSVLTCIRPRDLDILVIAENQINSLSWASLKSEISESRKSLIQKIPLNILLLKKEELSNPGPVCRNILKKSVRVF